MCLALGKSNSSTYCLAGKLSTFLLEHPTHHTLVLLTDFLWANMGLEEATDYINLLVTTTRNICAHHHTHPSSLPCKLVCFNLFCGQSDIGVVLNSETLESNREKLEETQRLLVSMDPPTPQSNTLVLPDLQPVYGEDSVEVAFNTNNQPKQLVFIQQLPPADRSTSPNNLDPTCDDDKMEILLFNSDFTVNFNDGTRMKNNTYMQSLS